MGLSLPWLLLLGLLLPAALMVPLLIEHRRTYDKGPRAVPTTTLDFDRRQTRTAGRRRSIKDPKVMPGLTHLAVDLEVIAGTEMEGNMVTRGRLTVGRGATLRGSAKAVRGVHLLEEATAYGNLISEGDVELERLSRVHGIVYCAGDVTLKPGAVVKGIYTDGRVDVYPGAEILEDVIAGKGIHLVVPMEDSRVLEELESLNALLSPREHWGEGE